MKTDYKTALILSIAISLLLNVIFIVSFFYHKEVPQAMGRRIPEFNLQRTVIDISSNFLLTFILYILNFNLLKLRIRKNLQLLLIIVLTIILTYFISISISGFQLDFFELEHRPRAVKGFTRMGLNRDYLIALLVVLSSQLIYVSQKQQKTALENEALRAEYMRSRYEALKNQVDPHFLFNSLNTLNSLIKVNSDKAQEYVQQLSFVFRYTLQNNEVITLREELDYTKAYCHLMQIRYGNNLRFEYNVDAKFYDYLIIPLSLQTLVENAIKHNVVSAKQPLTVKIDECNESIRVSNPIQLKKEVEVGEGIGLANLTERYRLMWKKEIVTVKTENTFEVTVPLMKKS
ncbi:MAG: histidine kinase [Prevotellaceae bacterium]|jgi:sensor histidine kinase YesM|nr:histidine kinase [Prevotellaceae bacterium]